jgi:hypothetical protein
MIVRGMIDAGINNVIYMELYSGPKMAHGKCGKTKVAGMIDRDSTVLKDSFTCMHSCGYVFTCSICYCTPILTKYNFFTNLEKCSTTFHKNLFGSS